MVEQYKKPYLDSSVFIALVKREIRGDVNRGEIAKHILDSAANGQFPIVTSTLTLAEVHKKRGMASTLSTAQDETILALFENEYVQLVDLDRLIGERANRLCREYDLLGNDAVHLASAMRAGCDVLLAWDHHLTDICRQDIRIEEPTMIGQQHLDI